MKWFLSKLFKRPPNNEQFFQDFYLSHWCTVLNEIQKTKAETFSERGVNLFELYSFCSFLVVEAYHHVWKDVLPIETINAKRDAMHKTMGGYAVNLLRTNYYPNQMEQQLVKEYISASQRNYTEFANALRADLGELTHPDETNPMFGTRLACLLGERLYPKIDNVTPASVDHGLSVGICMQYLRCMQEFSSRPGDH